MSVFTPSFSEHSLLHYKLFHRSLFIDAAVWVWNVLSECCQSWKLVWMCPRPCSVCGSPRLCRRRERCLVMARFSRWRGERFGQYRCLTLRYSLLLAVWVDPSAEHRIRWPVTLSFFEHSLTYYAVFFFTGISLWIRLWPIPSTTTTVCSLRMMTPPLTLTTAMQIAAAYGGDELWAQGATVPPDPYSLD